MSDAEEVGSVGEEAWKLWRALSSSEHDTTDAPFDAEVRDGSANSSVGPHSCPTGWCPICQVVGFVQEHPEAVARVGASAASLLHTIRDLMSTPQDPR